MSDDRARDPADVPVDRPLDSWLEALGRPTGSPGGGAASGVMLGIAASLMGMVAGYASDSADAEECADRLARRRSEALQAVEEDGIVSARFGAALALPADDPDRDHRVGVAAIEAAESVAKLGTIGLTLLTEARLLAVIGNPSLAVDLAVAVEALGAGLSGASLNLRSNLKLARDHHAPASRMADLDPNIVRLSDAGRIIAQLAEELSSRLD
ncbi:MULTISPECIES: cyclodeaminase/cyclohydrolase family protein [unclassified Microbacterium]|uniref:cyclodeaminase/cyclohydrolase family protein n=1 Tax=unclassified Microbacterium TaxID=2609290 RepID=UPI00109CB548|nr:MULTISPECIES: cyclodeaminase/cyclohydrolase family protein [unclassified Microbacterium]